MLNVFPRSNPSGEGERSRLDTVLGVRDIVGVFKVGDGIERAMNRPLTLGRFCQARLETWGAARKHKDTSNFNTRDDTNTRHRETTHRTRLAHWFKSHFRHHDGTVPDGLKIQSHDS